MTTVTQSTDKKYLGISLFSSAGIGELGLAKTGINIIASNEYLKDRHALYARNFPTTKCFTGDIWIEKDNILRYYRSKFQNQDLFLVYATPPCQGMSTNGTGRLRHEVRHGRRLPADQRNRLIIPAMDVICALRPRWIVLENVPGMRNTTITEDGRPVKIMDYIADRLGKEYVGKGEVLCCADYGIAQKRKRLITVYTRDANGAKYFIEKGLTFFPKDEHKPPITLREATGHLPPLDGREGFERRSDFHPLHYVPLMKPEKYWWVSHTKEGDQAYNNQCVNAKCRYDKNARHEDMLQDGRWQSSKQTPIYCVKCGELLPRPSLLDKKSGKRRLIKGFHSAYRRMWWDKPAPALTQNFLFEASDNKLHPEQNRVLSLYEALCLQSVNEYSYDFTIGGKNISKNMFAEIIGESVPPKLLEMVCSKILRLSGLPISSQNGRLDRETKDIDTIPTCKLAHAKKVKVRQSELQFTI